MELSKTEQRLLWLLVNNQGQTISRSVLVDQIWTDGDEYVAENALSVAVKRLRDKLSAQTCIKTVYGIGYMWVAGHGLILGISCLFLAAAVAFFSHRTLHRTMDKLDAMLAAAMDGTFQESTFDESMLSTLETYFAHYLSTSAASAQNVMVEKERIKELIGDISLQTKIHIANLLLYTELLQEEALSPQSQSMCPPSTPRQQSCSF